MRVLLTMVVGWFGLVGAAHACEAYFGKTLAPEDLRPKMIVDVQRITPVADPGEVLDDTHPSFGLDDYLEAQNVRGTMVVHRVDFMPDNTVHVEFIALADLERTDHGDFKLRRGKVRPFARYSYDFVDGSKEPPRFRVVGRAEGLDGYYKSFLMRGDETP